MEQQKKMGRPPDAGEPRADRLRVRITSSERAALERAAAQKGFPDLSHYVRATLLERDMN